MIKPGEIQKKAREVGVRDQQIEKDYIISWILQGIAQHTQLSMSIVFKGGTVLKKVYFKDYRFSEDLDFTLLNSYVEKRSIVEWFFEVFEYIQDKANVPLSIVDHNEQKDSDINFYIRYVGPLGGFGANKKVKVDISGSEHLQFKSVRAAAILGYSDQENHMLHCYPLEEVLVEKMRAVMQRMQARDLYDIWYLTEIHKMDMAYYLGNLGQNVKTKASTLEIFIPN